MKRLILTLFAVLGLVATSFAIATAQPTERDTSFVSALTGEVIDLGTSGQIVFLPEEYEFSEGESFSEEYIWFTHGWSNFQLVLVQGEVQPQEYFDVTLANMLEFYETFDIVDEAVTADHANFIANATYQGEATAVFYDYQLDAFGDVDLLVMQFAAAENMGADMAFVQQEVTIGNQPLLLNTDAAEVSSLLTGDQPAAVQTPATSGRATVGTGGISERLGRVGTSSTNDPTVEPTAVTGTTRSTRTTRTTAAAQPTEAATTTRTTRTTRTTTAAQPTEPTGGAWESMGLVSDTEWISPNFGTSVTWDATTWVFPADYEQAVFLSEDPLFDLVVLETVDGEGFVFLSVQDTGRETPDTMADFWLSPDFAATFEAEMTIVEVSTTSNSAAVVYQTVTNSNDPLLIVQTASFLDDGTLVLTRIASSPESLASVYGQFVDGVQVNGIPLDLTYTADEIAVLSGS